MKCATCNLHKEGAFDHIQSLEKGVEEWRSESQKNARHAEAARATGRVAINHLLAVVSASDEAQQRLAKEAAVDWLQSIGADV